MCGIIGFIGKNPVAGDIRNGLLTLQHRGQDAAGILTFDGDIHVIKETGLVTEIFSKEDLTSLSGKIGIGHARYPTIGSILNDDSQPFHMERPTLIAIAENGNIVNFSELKKQMEAEGETFTSNNDGELILKMMAKEMSKEPFYDPESMFKAVKRTMERLNGSYSIVGMTGKYLFAFRDPCGIKPLVMGKREDGYGFASETVALEVQEYSVVRDVAPGEMVIIDKNLNIDAQVLKQDKRAHCMFEWVYFSRTDSCIEKIGVYEARINLGIELAKIWKEKSIDVDVVIPVPDTARPAALSFAEEIGIRYTEGFIKNRYINRTFIMASQERRETAMKLKVNPIIKELKDKRVAVVDDSLVRGTTSKRIVKMLRDAGAKEVHLLLTCPPIRYPCFYGIDMSTRLELAAATKTIDEIRQFIGADSLTYMTQEGLNNALGINLCCACLDSNYPTVIPQDVMDSFEKQREKEKKEAGIVQNKNT